VDDASLRLARPGAAPAFVLSRRKRRFARLIWQLRPPALDLAESIGQIDHDYEFQRELDRLRCLAQDLDAHAGCGGNEFNEVRRCGVQLLDILADLGTGLSVLDSSLALVHGKLAGLVPYCQQGPGSQLVRIGRRKQQEVLWSIAEVAWHSALIGEQAKRASHDLGKAIDLNPIHELATMEIDASGVDLSRTDIRDLAQLEGVIWTDRTTWPRDFPADWVRAHSELIEPGKYRVCSGRGRDRTPVNV